MVIAIVVPAIAGAITLPIQLAGATISKARSSFNMQEPDALTPPEFLPIISSPPSLDITEELPTVNLPHKRAFEQAVIMPESFINRMDDPEQFLNKLRSVDSPAEVLRDIEGPIEIFMSVPGPLREIPNPIADIYYLRQSVLWFVWDGRTMFGSGFDNFIRNDIPVMRSSLTQSLHTGRETLDSVRDTNVKVRKKMLPSVQKTVDYRLPRTEKNVDNVLDKLAQFLDGGLFNMLF